MADRAGPLRQEHTGGAEIATAPGSVATKEDRSNYVAGDYLVCTNADGTDAYCVAKAKFGALYEADK